MTDTMVQTTYEVGDRVTATYSGQTYSGTVRALALGGYVVVQFDADNVPSWAYAYVNPTTGERWEGAYDTYPNGAIVLARVEPVAFNGDHADTGVSATEHGETSAYHEQDALIASLRQSVQAEREATLAARNTHRADISYIADALKTAAGENDLCEVFERQVENIGSGLSSLVSDSFIEEASRPQDRQYRVSYTITGSVTVTASDEEAAQTMVEDDPYQYFDRYDCDFNVDNVEDND